MKPLVALLLLGFSVLAMAQYTPVPENAAINDQFDRIRNLPMIMKADWPTNPFKSTVQGGPDTISVKDATAPAPARKEFDRGMDQLSRAKGPEAISHFQKAIEIYPQYVSAHNNMGVALMYMQEYDRAKSAFDKAYSLNSQVPVILLNLCRVSLQQKDFDNAESFAGKAVLLDSGAEALTLLAFTKLLNGKFDEAVADGRKVHSSGKHDAYAIAHFVTGRALQLKGDKDAAVNEYKLFLKEDPRSPRAELAKTALKELGYQ